MSTLCHTLTIFIVITKINYVIKILFKVPISLHLCYLPDHPSSGVSATRAGWRQCTDEAVLQVKKPN